MENEKDEDYSTDKIEITPEMIEAAASVLLGVEGVDFGQGYVRLIAARVLGAAFEILDGRNSVVRQESW